MRYQLEVLRKDGGKDVSNSDDRLIICRDARGACRKPGIISAIVYDLESSQGDMDAWLISRGMPTVSEIYYQRGESV